jgi:translation initiation factor eIF-2B subunit delta
VNNLIVADFTDKTAPVVGDVKAKPTTKAERRALQEAQRAAKAQATAKDKPTQKESSAGSEKTAGGERKVPSAQPVPKKVDVEKNETTFKPEIGLKSETKIAAEAQLPRQKQRKESETDVSKTVDEAVAGYEENCETGYIPATEESLFASLEECWLNGLFPWGTDKTGDEDELDLEFPDVDPMFQELGAKFSNFVIRGSNQRTIELLKVVKCYVKEYRTPEGKGFKQDLSTKLQHYLNKLKLYRPFAVGMNSAVEGLNAAIRGLTGDMSDEQCKEYLNDWCDTFIYEKIEKAAEAIAQKGCEKIQDGDKILLYSLTDAIYEVFKQAGEMEKKFQIILAITNSKTYLDDYKRLKESIGATVLQNSVRISCINASCIMTIISSVNKVFLGGHALFTTGGVMAHAGSSTIAMCALQQNIPVLFFCETYKFCDKSPTDTFYQDIFSENTLCLIPDRSPTDASGLDSTFYNNGFHTADVVMARIRYDVTPVNLVTCVITDIDILPSSSVPVVLRVQESRSLTKQ